VIRRLADALLSALLAPPCAVCARVLDRPLDGAVCEACWTAIAAHAPLVRHDGLVVRAAAIGEYDGVLRDIIHALKYDGRRTTAPRLAQLMVQHGGDVLTGAHALVPVPLHPRRERERGFNQADDLARPMGLPVARILRRTRMTAPQVELPAGARRRNVTGAFELVDQSELTGRVLVLVDDVTTTGATLEACALVLKRAGAQEIRALTAARVSSARH
jgi:ComF family protein